MKQITEITVRNVKGIENHTFDHNILPNKPTIMVASNGFGKSSLAIAFDSLKQTGISLDKTHFHKNDVTKLPEILVTFDDGSAIHNLVADNQRNTIKDHFETLVVRNSLKPTANLQNIGGRHNASPSLNIEDIVLIRTIPEKVGFDYKYADTKRDFGSSGKILPNLKDILSNKEFVLALHDANVHFDRLDGLRNAAKIVAFKNHTNQLTGTANQIIGNLDFTPLDGVDPLENAVPVIQKYFPDDQNPLLIAMQVADEFVASDMVNIAKRYGYDLKKGQAEKLLEPLTDTWQTIKPKENRQKGLVVEFPKAHQISNGERDIICLVAKLIKFAFQLKKERSILLIDDVFDYLDDANLIAVQFYISNLIQQAKDMGVEIYPIILTHLDPIYFRTFSFKKQKIEYLEKRANAVPEQVQKIVLNREDTRIKDDLSKYFLHYHTGNGTLQDADVNALGLDHGIKDSAAFLAYVNAEFDSYLDDDPYDPISVGIALRIKVEKIIHDLLPHGDRAEFLGIHRTTKKLDFAEEKLVDIPEYFYMLGTIYNGITHIRNPNADNFTPWFTKLDNKTIKSIVRKLT